MNNKDTSESIIETKNSDITQIIILGRLDCPRVTMCRQIVEDMYAKKIWNVKFEFTIAFETPFEFHKEQLNMENLEFLNYTQSPIIYTQNKKKEIIGSLEEFLVYLKTNFCYYEERNENSFKELNRLLLRNYMKENGNKYCFFNISMAGKSLDPVVIELFYRECPKTCENFLALCRGANNSNGETLTYKNSIFHRVVKSGYIQGGDLNSTAKGPKSIHKGEFPDENYSVTHSYPGVVGMVKKGNRKHSNESQFYITLTSTKAFDQLFVAFGRVIQGFKTIKEIDNVDTFLQKPVSQVKIESCGEYDI